MHPHALQARSADCIRLHATQSSCFSCPVVVGQSVTQRLHRLGTLDPTHQLLLSATAVAAAAAADAAQTSADAGSDSSSLESIIADVLNANRTQLQRPSDLLDLIDSTGNGLQTVVRRSWDTTGIRLTLEGTWAKTAEARKMAMLAVYQERLVARAVALLHLLRWLAAARPGLLDASVVKQVESLAAVDDINPAVQVLMVPQLTLMAAALYPWPVLAQVVEAAVQRAQQALFSKPPYNYSPSKCNTAQVQLQWVEASLCRGAAMARLRALLLQQGRLQHWQQQADAAAAAAGPALQGLTAEQAYHEHWKQQQQQQTKQHQGGETGATATAAAAVVGGAGRTLFAGFHARGAQQPCVWQAAPGVAATGAAAVNLGLPKVVAAGAAGAAAAGGSKASWDVSCDAAEQHQLCSVISSLTERVRHLKQQMGPTDAALGVLPEVQNAHRSALLDLLISWAELSPALQLPRPAPIVAAKVAISSIEHDRLLRRIALETSGAEVGVLRRLAKTKGAGFLAQFSPSVGNPFASTQEWDYFRECPGVFARLVVDPPTQSASLTIKSLGVGQQQQQHQQQQHQTHQQQQTTNNAAEIKLSGAELQELMQQLLHVLSGTVAGSAAVPFAAAAGGTSSSNSSSTATAASGEPGNRQITFRALVSSNSSSGRGSLFGSSVQGSAADAGSGGLELLVDGQTATQLLPVHVTSLVTVVEDLAGQLPQQYNTMRHLPEMQITPASPLGQSTAAALSWITTAARAAAAAALVALPLLAMARPFRGLQLLPTAATHTVVTDAAAKSSSSSSSSRPTDSQASRSSSSSIESSQPVLNAQLSAAEMQQLCDVVAARVVGQVWLSSSEALIDEATEHKLVNATSSSSTAATAAAAADGPAPQSLGLMFQVVADGSGRVLGLNPCSSAAAAVVWELPLAADLKGSRLARIQDKRRSTITSAPGKASAKKSPGPSISQISYQPVLQHHIPAEGVAVLKLVLRPAAAAGAPRNTPAATATAPTPIAEVDSSLQTSPSSSSSSDGDPSKPVKPVAGSQQQLQHTEQNLHHQQQGQQQQGQPTVLSVGSGKKAAMMWLMQPGVTPWTDGDSLAAWTTRGAVLQQQQQQLTADGGAVSVQSTIKDDTSVLSAAAAGDGAGADSPAGMSLSVDGQPVQSLEAFVHQLLAASQQEAAAAAAPVNSSGSNKRS